jgi:hypothetical protein
MSTARPAALPFTKIIVYASQIPACIGANKYAKPAEAFEKLWQRVAPQSFKNALARHALKTDDQRLDEIVAQHVSVASAVKDAESLADRVRASPEVAKAYVAASKAIEPTLSAADTKVVDAAIRKTMFTSFGTRNESDIFEAVRGRLKFDIERDESFKHVVIGDIDGIEWGIGGRIDGISVDGNTVVEIKQRINRLFGVAPPYEYVQIQCYLHMIESATQGVLVECYCPPQGGRIMNVIPVDKDDEVWDDDIRPKLEAFVCYLIGLVGDEGMQDTYLKSKQRSALITKRFP